MRAIGYICLAACCMALASCGTLGKKSPLRSKEAPSPAANAGWPPPPIGADAGLAQSTSPQKRGGLLAGRVLDSYDRPPPPTYIQVVPAGGESKNSPLEVATDSQGYFTIQGLQPGQHYQLIARTRGGETKLAGTTWATPPNPRLLILMSQDFATASTPAPPPPPAPPSGKSGATTAPPSKPPDTSDPGSGNSAGESNREPAKSSNNGPTAGSATIGPPMRLNEPSKSPAAPPSVLPRPPASDIRPQDIADTPPGGVRLPPVTNIPPQADMGRPPAVPSCVLTGKQLHNFALYGLDSRPWEYRSHQGRVVLLVFWETACLPCRAAIPSLKTFQKRYGPHGLEVIAIAYEDGPLKEQIRKVQNVRDRLGINYRLLLGGEAGSCPVRIQFGVSAFPTLVLLDDHNRIIWRHQGLDSYKLQELEMLIQQQIRRH